MVQWACPGEKGTKKEVNKMFGKFFYIWNGESGEFVTCDKLNILLKEYKTLKKEMLQPQKVKFRYKNKKIKRLYHL